MRWRNCINALMALWIVVSPWILRVSHQGNVLASCVIGGAVLCVVSVWGAVADEWNQWGIAISAACGLWFVVQPFLGHYTNGAYWGLVVPGIVTVFLDFWTWMTNPSVGLQGRSRRRA